MLAFPVNKLLTFSQAPLAVLDERMCANSFSDMAFWMMFNAVALSWQSTTSFLVRSLGKTGEKPLSMMFQTSTEQLFIRDSMRNCQREKLVVLIFGGLLCIEV